MSDFPTDHRWSVGCFFGQMYRCYSKLMFPIYHPHIMVVEVSLEAHGGRA